MVRHESAKSSNHNAKHHKSTGGANKAATNKRTPNTVSYHLVPTKDSKHISMQVSGRNKSHTEKKARSPEEESPPWGTLLKEFTQETTLLASDTPLHIPDSSLEGKHFILRVFTLLQW